MISPMLMICSAYVQVEKTRVYVFVGPNHLDRMTGLAKTLTFTAELMTDDQTKS